MMGPGSGRSVLSQFFQPGSTFNWRKYQGNVYDNSAVGLWLEFVSRNWGQSQLVGQKQNAKGQWEFAEDDPFPGYVARPNPWYDGHTLWQATVLSRVASGNAYWLKLRRGDGSPAFAWLPHNRVTPVTKTSDWIDYYEFRDYGGNLAKFPVEAVIHYRNGINPDDPRLGVSPLAAQLRQIGMINLADAYCGAILHKMGVPGLVVTAKDKDFPPGSAKVIQQQIEDKFTVDGAGSTMVLGYTSDVRALEATPEKMALQRLQDIPVARVCGALGCDPGVLAQPSETSKHHANVDSMIGSAWRQGIIPMQVDFASALSFALGYEEKRRLWFDTSGVAELQEDKAELATIASMMWDSGWGKRSEARGIMGLESGPEDEVYKSDVTMAEAQAALPAKAGKIAKNRAKRWSDLEDSGQPEED